MADLSSLFKYAPMTGGFMLGGQLADQEKMDALTREGKQIDNNLNQQSYDFNTQLNPLKVQYQKGINDRQSAELPGITADSQFKSRTLDGRVGVENQKSSNEMGNLKTMDYERARRAVTEASMQVGDVADPLQRSLVMSQILQKHGVDTNDPLIQGITNLAIRDPQAFRKHADEIDQRTAKNSSAYMAATDSARIQSQERDAASEREWRTRKEISTDQINAGRFKDHKFAATIDQRIDAAKDPVERYSILLDAYKQAQMAGKEDLALSYWQRAENLKNVASAKLDTAPKPGTPNLPGMTNNRIPVNPNLNVAPGQSAPMPGGAPQPAPQQVPAPTHRYGGQALPPAAIDMLKQNANDPTTRAYFDQTFGAGAAAAILGK